MDIREREELEAFVINSLCYIQGLDEDFEHAAVVKEVKAMSDKELEDEADWCDYLLDK